MRCQLKKANVQSVASCALVVDGFLFTWGGLFQFRTQANTCLNCLIEVPSVRHTLGKY